MAISVKTNGQKSVEKRKTDTNWVARGSLELILAPLEPEFCNLSFLFFEIDSKDNEKRLISNFFPRHWSVITQNPVKIH